MGWDGRRGRLTNPDAVAWQELVAATVTLWTVAIDTRIDDAEPQGVPPGRVRRASPRWRASGVAQQVIRMLQRGMHQLRWVLAHGR